MDLFVAEKPRNRPRLSDSAQGSPAAPRFLAKMESGSAFCAGQSSRAAHFHWREAGFGSYPLWHPDNQIGGPINYLTASSPFGGSSTWLRFSGAFLYQAAPDWTRSGKPCSKPWNQCNCGLLRRLAPAGYEEGAPSFLDHQLGRTSCRNRP
jgi:hypothetical protein